MEGTPSNIDLSALKKSLLSLDEVKSIHDLHIWSITSDFHIEHTTIQVDKEHSQCKDHDYCN